MESFAENNCKAEKKEIWVTALFLGSIIVSVLSGGSWYAPIIQLKWSFCTIYRCRLCSDDFFWNSTISANIKKYIYSLWYTYFYMYYLIQYSEGKKQTYLISLCTCYDWLGWCWQMMTHCSIWYPVYYFYEYEKDNIY